MGCVRYLRDWWQSSSVVHHKVSIAGTNLDRNCDRELQRFIQILHTTAVLHKSPRFNESSAPFLRLNYNFIHFLRLIWAISSDSHAFLVYFQLIYSIPSRSRLRRALASIIFVLAELSATHRSLLFARNKAVSIQIHNSLVVRRALVWIFYTRNERKDCLLSPPGPARGSENGAKSKSEINNAWICELLKVSGHRKFISGCSERRVVATFASNIGIFPTVNTTEAWVQRCKRFPRILLKKKSPCRPSTRHLTRNCYGLFMIRSFRTKSHLRRESDCTNSAETLGAEISREWKRPFIY